MRDLKVNARVQECKNQLMWIGLAKYITSIQNKFYLILAADVKNARIWKENSDKNTQKVENLPMVMFN